MAVAGIYGSPLLSDLLGLGIALTARCWQHGALESHLSKQQLGGTGQLVRQDGMLGSCPIREVLFLVEAVALENNNMEKG